MDKEQQAFERLRQGAMMSERYYDKPLMICYSGGKDSDVLVELALRSEINFEVVNSHTTADAPETVRYIRQRFKELEELGIKCTIEYSKYKGKRTSMWELIPIKKMPPTRLMRYCCSVLKETSGDGRAIATGVRWAESANRKRRGIYEDIKVNQEKKIILTNDNDEKRQLFESCLTKAKIVVNPIIDWSEADVWDYLHDCGCFSNPLYQCGFNRIGCIGCPMATANKRYFEFRRYPKYKELYIKAFDRMIAQEPSRYRWKNGQECFEWWMGEDPNQIKFDLGD